MSVVSHIAKTPRRWLASTVTLTLLAATGCSLLPSSQQVFQVKLKESIVPPIAKFDAKNANEKVYDHVAVLTSSGKQVVLDARRTPILFAAYWCPHCQRTLVLWSEHKSQLRRLPVYVSMGFAPGTTLQQAVKITSDEERQLHLAKFQVYYLLDKSKLATYVPVGYPTVVFPYGDTVKMLEAEHTFPIWKLAINAASNQQST